MKDEPLIIIHEYNAPLTSVWQAITDPKLMREWYFDVSDFRPEVGFKFQFEGGDEKKRYIHYCEVLEVIPFEKLKYSWEYEGYEGISFVTFELSSIGQKTQLKLIHEGLDNFTNPDFMRANFMGGWTFLIQKSLTEFLNNDKSLRDW